MIEKKKDISNLENSNGEKLSNTKGIIRCNHIIDKKWSLKTIVDNLNSLTNSIVLYTYCGHIIRVKFLCEFYRLKLKKPTTGSLRLM